MKVIAIKSFISEQDSGCTKRAIMKIIALKVYYAFCINSNRGYRHREYLISINNGIDPMNMPLNEFTYVNRNELTEHFRKIEE